MDDVPMSMLFWKQDIKPVVRKLTARVRIRSVSAVVVAQEQDWIETRGCSMSRSRAAK